MKKRKRIKIGTKLRPALDCKGIELNKGEALGKIDIAPRCFGADMPYDGHPR